MGTWGSGNFENDVAMDRLCWICENILDEIDGVFDGDPVALDPDEASFDELLVNLDIMTALAKHIRSKPLALGMPEEIVVPLFPGNFPSKDTIDQWENKVIERFDQYYSDGKPWLERRNEVIRTFADMREQANVLEEKSKAANEFIEKENTEWDALPEEEKKRQETEAFEMLDEIFNSDDE